MQFFLILGLITVATVIVKLGYSENGPPPLDKFANATEMNEDNVSEVLKGQGIGGGEPGIGGPDVIENTTASDTVPDFGLDHFLPPNATGGVSTTIASLPNTQDGDHEKDMNNEQNMKKPQRARENRKGGAKSGKSDRGSNGMRNRGTTAPGLRSDLSTDETWATSFSRNSTGGPKPTEQPGRQTVIGVHTAIVALLYFGIILSLAVLTSKFIKKRWRSCRNRNTPSTTDINEKSIYPL
ncbi:uncharacterized protein LOC124171373 [Ischnura elegans]|uniref:uncharacterized protein LOC124171373 n=1 Tax=Ischnura elegans TaxID=197161 RepID=UPI001ED86DAF|nr:uncharacterized protein LOC124171373 [Ischnura elegans]